MEYKTIEKNIIGFSISNKGDSYTQGFNPKTGMTLDGNFSNASSEEVNLAVEKANEAFEEYRNISGKQKALFLNAIADDLNTPLAIAEMHKLAKSGNIKDLKASGIFLGLFGNSSNQKSKLTISQDSQQLIEFLFKQRMDARKRKDYARADELRDGFIQAGLIINDTKDGIVWELSDDFDIKKLEDLQ